MTNLYKVEGLVKNILETYEDTRNDDFVLIYRVYKEINESAMVRELFFEVMLNHKKYGLPAFESITRARRKLQAEYEELRAKKIVTDERINKTSDYINYAIDGYNPTFMKFVDCQE